MASPGAFSRDVSLRAGESLALLVTLPPSAEELLVEWRVEAAEYDVGVEATVAEVADLGGGNGVDAADDAGAASAAVVLPRLRLRDTGAAAFLLAPSASARALRVALDNSFSRLRGKAVAIRASGRTAAGAPAAARGAASRLLDARDARAVNAAATAGLALFFTNRFEEAEAAFSLEKDRVAVFSPSRPWRGCAP